jgi:hypothetical protein
MRLHGINQESEQQKIIDAIITLLNQQKYFAETKLKHLPVK